MVNQVDDVPELPRRAHHAHKGSFGTLLVLAGHPGMLGAAILAARGALRGGAGMVRCGLPAELMASMAVAVPGATSFDRKTLSRELFAVVDAVVCGPGLGTDPAAGEVLEMVRAHCRRPLVLDADALNLLAPLAEPLSLHAPLVITPHPGEAGRLLGCSSAEVQADRPAAVARLASLSGGVAVLKGAGTLVGDAEGCYANASGNPGMATAGSGDVLSGLIGALLAQGMTCFDAACLAVSVHGRAGDRIAAKYSQAGLCAEDLPLAIAEVLGE